MILRKPYAILIKYFKIIHIVMFVLFVYLVFALRKVYIFFSNYIKTSNYVYVPNMGKIYVPTLLFIVVVALLALSISILLLMRKKEKPVLFYKIMILYCILLLIILIYFASFFKSLDNTVYEPLRIVINRDISLFSYIFNFFFVAFSFIRGFGFDIKKFSFEKDKKELNLEESDSEEYELNVGIEKDDVKSFLNRHKREFNYYVKANKTFLIIFAIIIIVVSGVYVYYDTFVINKVYKENVDINFGGIVYHVNSSSISNIDKYGQEISTSDEYLIINMNFTNTNKTGPLDQEALRVKIGEDYYYPSAVSCELFSDLGTCYNGQDLKVNTLSNYIMVYKIKKANDEIYLEVLRDKSKGYVYNKVKLLYNREEPQDVVADNKEFEIDNNKYQIINYLLSDKETYQYEECIQEKCNKYTKIVFPNTGELVLTLEINDLDKLSDEVLSSAFGIKYNDTVFTGKSVKLINKHDNKVYYSVPRFLKQVNGFTILVNTRKVRYNIVVGGK